MNTKKIKSMFLSPINIIIITSLIIFIIFSSLTLCVDCIGPDCGYCNGCHYQIDCWTKGIIQNSYILIGILIILYIISFLLIYKFNKF
jgi:hypothetical protein